jgi:hypothetical protein
MHHVEVFVQSHRRLERSIRLRVRELGWNGCLDGRLRERQIHRICYMRWGVDGVKRGIASLFGSWSFVWRL